MAVFVLRYYKSRYTGFFSFQRSFQKLEYSNHKEENITFINDFK